MDESHHHHHNNAPSRGRGRGRGGRRGRGGNEFGSPRRNPPSAPVPLSSQVNPGAGVSIVLKVDQPTGRQVQGIIDEVLGRGNHPRGIKVRLVDGRVGRVQAIVSEEAARESSGGLANLGRNGEPVGATTSQHDHRTIRTEQRPQFTDMRYDDPYDYESSQASRDGPNLLDFVRPKPKKGRKATRADDAAEEPQSQVTSSNLIKCPVCGDFEGDEEAVAFHVNTHFE
jgi:uncharacterized repeat protein (TIGR03833 family)